MSIMSTMDKNVIAAGAENRPPMLERSRYDSWQKSVHRREGTLADLTHEEKIRRACDIKATNIILQGLSLDVYTLLNHHKVAKEIWDIVKLLMEGSELSLQERESNLNIDFDRFTSEKGETIQTYYLRFANQRDKFVTNVKLAKDMHSFNQQFLAPQQQQFYSLLLQQQAYEAPDVYQQPRAVPTQLDSGIVLPSFHDPIESLNKAMTFISTAFTLRYPQTNNQLRTSSNPKNQATIHDGSVTVQNVQGRQTQSYGGNMAKGEVHIARQCTQAKKAQNSERFKDKMLLAQAQEVGVVMDEEQLAFLADNGEAVISRSPQARVVFMENLTPAGPIYDADTSPSYDSHIL
ncbi:hypothetical protein Tco_0866630 [Tanacetum coccineum]